MSADTSETDPGSAPTLDADDFADGAQEDQQHSAKAERARIAFRRHAKFRHDMMAVEIHARLLCGAYHNYPSNLPPEVSEHIATVLECHNILVARTRAKLGQDAQFSVRFGDRVMAAGPFAIHFYKEESLDHHHPHYIATLLVCLAMADIAAGSDSHAPERYEIPLTASALSHACVMSMATLDAYLVDILRSLLTEAPEKLCGRKKTVTWDQVIDAASLSDLHRSIIEISLDEFSHATLLKKLGMMKSDYDLSFEVDASTWKQLEFAEIRRNLLVHSDGRVTKTFQRRFAALGENPGEETPVLGEPISLTWSTVERQCRDAVAIAEMVFVAMSQDVFGGLVVRQQ